MGWRGLAVIATVLGLAMTGVRQVEAFKKSPGPIQSSFTYCFASSMGTYERIRFRDGVRSWNTRGFSMTASEVSCANPGALTVRMGVYGDGQGGTLAVANTNQVGSVVEILFDIEEIWHTDNSSPPCDEADFWGLAAHEIGHAWGLAHPPNRAAPDGTIKTMTSPQQAYTCAPAEEWSRARTLSSDDEAGALWIKSGHFMPNFSFERGTCDNISPIECAPSYYWTRPTSWPRACDANAQLGSCYQRMIGIGTVEQIVRRYVCNFDAPGGLCNGRLRFYWQNRATGTTTIRVRIFDISAEPDLTLADTTCSGADWVWSLCEVNFRPLITSGERAYKYAITNHTTREYWLDNVQITDF